MTGEYLFPARWPSHANPHWTSCLRCLLEGDWMERFEGCYCINHPWDRIDVGTPAVPDLQWICSVCLKIAGPAFDEARQ